MKQPIEAFTWLIEQFRRYCRLELTWLDVRHVLTESEGLCKQYQNLPRLDDLNLFMAAMRKTLPQHVTLIDCTDDYLWHRLRQHVAREDALAIASVSLIIWQRTQ